MNSNAFENNSSLTCLSKQRIFSGMLYRYKHASDVTHGDMTFAVFLPEAANASDAAVPVLYWLSGLTCTDENFCQKAGAFKAASALGLAIVCPDTSPRGTCYPREHDSYDLGSGAGFYVNAVREPWAQTYQMYDYVTQELPALIESLFPVSTKKSISGHSMGGHGALMCALRNPKVYASVSAFSPIVNPMACSWGQSIFKEYLGDDKSLWEIYDSCEQINQTSGYKIPLLIEQGADDEFLPTQLCLGNIEAACKKNDHPITVNMREGFDHSYYFVATFIEEHLKYHARLLGLDL